MLATACGDNVEVATWRGAERLATTECAFGGTAIDQIAVDAKSIYWGGGCNGTLYKAPLAGGGAIALAYDERYCVHGVYLRDDRVYFTTGCNGTAAVIGKDGSNSTVLVAAMDCVHSLVGNDDSLYLTTAGSVVRLPYDGSPMTVVADQRSSAEAIALRSNTVSWIELVTVGNAVVGALMQASLPAGMDALLVTNVDSETALAATETDFVFASQGNLVRFTAQHTSVALAPIAGNVRDVKIDGHTVYWVDDGSVSKVDLDGGAVTVIASHTGRIDGAPGLALDASRVYWTDGCGVLAAPK